MAVTTSLVCAGCGVTFDKPTKEVRRQQARDPGRDFFCDRSCYARHRGSANLGDHLGNGRTEHLRPGNRADEFSPFRYFLNKARNRPGETDLTLEALRDLWDRQGGRCALSGLPIELPPTTGAFEQLRDCPWKASLDRLEPEKGYVIGNVRFVVMIANLARNRFSDEDLIRFCRATAGKHPS